MTEKLLKRFLFCDPNGGWVCHYENPSDSGFPTQLIYANNPIVRQFVKDSQIGENIVAGGCCIVRLIDG